MQITIRYTNHKADTLFVKELKHVDKYGIHPAGIYQFANKDGKIMFEVPVALVQDVDIPLHDTELTIPQLQLAQG